MGRNFNRNKRRKVSRFYSSACYKKFDYGKSRAPLISLSTDRKLLKNKELKYKENKLDRSRPF